MPGVSTSVTVGANDVLLWQTTSGVAPDPITTKAGNATAQVFNAGSDNDPTPILIRNTDATNSVVLGLNAAQSGPGVWPLKAGESIPFNVIGSDSLVASWDGTHSVVVDVLVMRQ